MAPQHHRPWIAPALESRPTSSASPLRECRPTARRTTSSDRTRRPRTSRASCLRRTSDSSLRISRLEYLASSSSAHRYDPSHRRSSSSGRRAWAGSVSRNIPKAPSRSLLTEPTLRSCVMFVETTWTELRSASSTVARHSGSVYARRQWNVNASSCSPVTTSKRLKQPAFRTCVTTSARNSAPKRSSDMATSSLFGLSKRQILRDPEELQIAMLSGGSMSL